MESKIKKYLFLIPIVCFVIYIGWFEYKQYRESQNFFTTDSVNFTDTTALICSWYDVRKGKDHTVTLNIAHQTKEFNRLVELTVDNEVVYWTTREDKLFLADNWTRRRANDCASMIFRITILGYKPYPKYSISNRSDSTGLIINAPQTVYDYPGMDVCYDLKSKITLPPPSN